MADAIMTGVIPGLCALLMLGMQRHPDRNRIGFELERGQ